MTGQLVYQENGENKALGGHPIEESESTLPNKHSHIIFSLDRGVLYYNDVRMFGYVLYFPHIQALYQAGHFEKLGPDPLDTDAFTYNYFYQQIMKRKGLLKPLLLGQSIVTGLGNIYVDEICFRAGILPYRNLQTLDEKEIQFLYNSIITVIPQAVSMGGSSVANYIMADGSRGTYAREHKVYGRSGKPCMTCDNPLSHKKIGGRTTVFCQFCQK
jgi:formamidopyrimidine-DNA glycosylase